MVLFKVHPENIILRDYYHLSPEIMKEGKIFYLPILHLYMNDSMSYPILDTHYNQELKSLSFC